MNELVLQPKQSLLLKAVTTSKKFWIGMGGGRGGAKSTALQRVMLARRMSCGGTVGAIVMRNYDQVKRYHIDPMLRDYPELINCYHKTESKMILPPKDKRHTNSEIHFTYAESLEEVIRRFRSANYYDVFIDQAEQFTEPEIREIKQCVRWTKVPEGTCKLVLAFNMGGVGIDFLRRIFHLHEYNRNETADQFGFIHVYPWDNVEWVRVALTSDGITEEDYYNWTDAQRQEYCATRGDYGRTLTSQDPVLVKRDWLGSWDTLEGAYFGLVFDRNSTVINDEQVARIIKPWWKRWLSMDWGRGHYCVTHWHARGELSPSEAKELLDWDATIPVKVAVTYREYIAGGAAASDEGSGRELSEYDIAQEIAYRTPKEERDQVRTFYLSPDAFAKRTSTHTIAQAMSTVMRANGMPSPSPADNDRIGGWALMYNLLLATKRHGIMPETSDGKQRDLGTWMISAQCPEAIDALPLLMRDPKNLDDVLKTDTSTIRMEQDVGDELRYGLKSMLGISHKPRQQEIAEKLDSITDMHKKSMVHRAMLAHRTTRASRKSFYVH